MKPFSLLVLAFVTPALGQLKWDQTIQTFAAKPLDRQVIAHYRFTNAGNSVVTIREVRTSCGCTTAALGKRQYSPGESGEIEARFQFAGRIGHQEKWIYITTDVKSDDLTLLRLAVDIPPAITIDPEFLMWRVGDPPEPKVFRIAVADEFPVAIVSVQSDDPAVKLEVRETRPGKALEVKVTPPPTTRPESATLVIRTDYPPENPDVHYAFVRVE
ncbi:MAG: DUF1573 domain-containing protein [Verrucomicrobia bacterium]|nr:DUF1573 domain-containing protein [Verrucomicrobiota bacterium]